MQVKGQVREYCVPDFKTLVGTMSNQFEALARTPDKFQKLGGRIPKGVLLVGPPGTGKSQTLTNIIAAALSEGKKVLFVSEKLAALEVVRHRLNHAGLGHFCLELHSHKTQKKPKKSGSMEIQ